MKHSFVSVRGISYPICRGCGLLRLRNTLTDWCVRQGCDYDEHPDYHRMLKTLPGKEERNPWSR